MKAIYYGLYSELVTLLALVVQRINNTIHWKNYYPVDSMLHFLTVICWMVIYLLDSVIHPLNNWALMVSRWLSLENDHSVHI